jgi:hypothetical protein
MLMWMLLLAVYAIAESLERSESVNRARLAPRQALRTGLNRLAVSASGASLFFSGPTDGAAVGVGSYTVNLPYRNNLNVWQAGDSMTVAVSEDLTRPVDVNADPTNPATELHDIDSNAASPDGFPDQTYTVVLLTTRERQQPSRTPGARDLLVVRWDQVEPEIPFQPSSIDLGDLGPPTNLSVYDAFLTPIDEDGFVVSYLDKDNVPNACSISARFRQVPLKQGPVQEETYNFIFTTRNT